MVTTGEAIAFPEVGGLHHRYERARFHDRQKTTNGGDPSRGRPYDAWLDVIGVISTGARDRERTTGEQFTAIVRAKARARRAR